MNSSWVVLAAMAAALAQPAGPGGFRIRAELTTPLTTATAKLNDAVELEALEDVMAGGKLWIPKGAHLLGHVGFVQKKSDQAAQAAISIVVDKAEWKGQSLALEAQVVSLESFGVDLMGQRTSGDPIPETTSTGKRIEQPPWVTAGRSGATVRRGSIPVPKDCGLENDKEIGSVIVCDRQQVVLTAGARVVLKQK